MRPRTWRLAASSLAVPLLAACSGGPQDEPAEAAADGFYAAVAAHDGSAACAALAPRTRDALEQSAGRPCIEAVTQADLAAPGAAEGVQVFGTGAQVRWSGDTTFLSRYGGRWLVTAAGCSPVAGDRYECQVEAG